MNLYMQNRRKKMENICRMKAKDGTERLEVRIYVYADRTEKTRV